MYDRLGQQSVVAVETDFAVAVEFAAAAVVDLGYC